MGDIDVSKGAVEDAIASPACERLRRAVFEPGFGRSGAIGVELECFVFERGKTVSLGMAGSDLTPGNFMRDLAAAAGPQATLVTDPLNGYPTALALPGGAKFCLENGGQIEYAGAPQLGLDAVADELHAALALCERAGAGRVGFLSHGTHPTLEARRDPLVPNSRYRIMERFFAPDSIHRWGNYTASIQVNIDVPEARDWPEALRLAFALSRFAYPLFANSRYLYDRPFPGGNARAHLLAGVDRSRQQLPTGLLLGGDPVEGYVEWALDAAVIFAGDLPLDALPRRGELTFRQWIVSGYRGTHPGLSHWLLHLGTLWPDVRPRRFIELRATDAQPFEHVMAAVAFWHALIQTAPGRRALRDFFSRLPGAEETAGADGVLGNVLWRDAGQALFRDEAWLQELLAIASTVLDGAGQGHWARAVAAFGRYRERVAGTLPLSGSEFVRQTRSDAPTLGFGRTRPG